ncbi:hypothetical protein E4U54_008263 [Claviceps lovelessii]|nr:hypothetical protein E4U54_008263 [Claviceps lovelessii]
MKYLLSGVAFAAAVIANKAGPYERCGGKDWTGPTSCVAGFNCTYSNEYYSQCSPLPYYSNGTRSGPYGQCGGKSWNGTTVCVNGYKCQYVNGWYSQCVLNGADANPSPSPSRPVPVIGKGHDHGHAKLKWFGFDQSSAEFTPGKKPGVSGEDYRFPDETSIHKLIQQGYNIFRIPFLMERMAAPHMTSPIQEDYFAGIRQLVDFITTDQGKHVILDAHNYGRYDDEIMTDTEAFRTFWKNLAGRFHDNANVIFDINNEYHNMDQKLVFDLNQAAIHGIRDSGAKEQYIMAEGNSNTGAWTWAKVNDNLKDLVDPSNKLIYEMHQYLDTDGSGASDECVSSTIGVERLEAATKWLRDNNKVGAIGEFAGGANPQCKEAVKGMLDHLEANSDVWMAALWWGGGSWWHDYRFSFELPDGTAYKYYSDLLSKYVPS